MRKLKKNEYICDSGGLESQIIKSDDTVEAAKAFYRINHYSKEFGELISIKTFNNETFYIATCVVKKVFEKEQKNKLNTFKVISKEN